MGALLYDCLLLLADVTMPSSGPFSGNLFKLCLPESQWDSSLFPPNQDAPALHLEVCLNTFNTNIVMRECFVFDRAPPVGVFREADSTSTASSTMREVKHFINPPPNTHGVTEGKELSSCNTELHGEIWTKLTVLTDFIKQFNTSVKNIRAQYFFMTK